MPSSRRWTHHRGQRFTPTATATLWRHQLWPGAMATCPCRRYGACDVNFLLGLQSTRCTVKPSVDVEDSLVEMGTCSLPKSMAFSIWVFFGGGKKYWWWLGCASQVAIEQSYVLTILYILYPYMANMWVIYVGYFLRLLFWDAHPNRSWYHPQWCNQLIMIYENHCSGWVKIGDVTHQPFYVDNMLR